MIIDSNKSDDFSKRLERLISYHLGISKTAFAERINVTPQYVSQLCKGKNIPSERTIKDICNEFTVNSDWLLEGKGENPFYEDDEDKVMDNIIKDLIEKNDEDLQEFLIMYSQLNHEDKKHIKYIIKRLIQ